MENIIKLPGAYPEITITCPNCNSPQVLVMLEPEGYYHVIECYQCNYKRKE